MTKEPIEVLDDLADQVADEFEAYRPPDEFKDVSLVIENSDTEHPTLIVHVDREDAESKRSSRRLSRTWTGTGGTRNAPSPIGVEIVHHQC